MNERAPFSITPTNKPETQQTASMEALAAFDEKLKESNMNEHMEDHIARGDFFHLLATYMGFLEETAADPDSVPPELRDMQVRLSASIRRSLQEMARKYHIMELPEKAA